MWLRSIARGKAWGQLHSEGGYRARMSYSIARGKACHRLGAELGLGFGQVQVWTLHPRPFAVHLIFDDGWALAGIGFGIGLDLHFAVLVSILQSTFMQLLSACGERERES